MPARFFAHGKQRMKGNFTIQEERTRNHTRRRWSVEEGGRTAKYSTDDLYDLADLLDEMLDFIEENPRDVPG